MSEDGFTVFTGGGRLPLHTSEEGFILGDDPPEAIRRWSQITELTHPNPASVALTLREGDQLLLAFISRAERDRFTAQAGDLRVPGAAETRTVPAYVGANIPLLTVDHVPGRQVVEFRALVTSQSVMSRHAFSDLGSDLKSVMGGNLAGMERAVADAISAARRSLSAAAHAAQADAVIGVTIAIAGFGDKAEAVVMSGTAVRTAEAAPTASDSAKV